MIVFKKLLIVSILVASSSQVPEIKTLYTNSPGYSEYFPLEENFAFGNTLRFSVRTSRDAHILLATSPHRDQPEYEIILGALNNTVNYIRGRHPEQKEPSSAIRTVNLLNPKEYRNIWIKLESDPQNTTLTIQLGVDKYSFQEWIDSTPLHPLYVSFGSKTWASWRYGYSDVANTEAVSEDRKVAVVTANEGSGTKYGQYHPLSEVISHSADHNSVTIYFMVQASGRLQVLLSPTVSASEDGYEFGLTATSAYFHRRSSEIIESSRQNFTQSNFRTGVLNGSTRHQYWIRLNKDGNTMMGKGGCKEPFLSWQDPSPIFPQFVGFALPKEEEHDDSDAPCDTEIDYGLGPDYKLSSQDCEPRWQDAWNQQLPPGAVRGGYSDKEELYICRANHKETYLPGSVIVGKDNKGECRVAYDINVHKKTEFQVLTGCRFRWVAASLGEVPDDAVVAGEFPGNVKVHVARVTQNGEVVIGKLHSNEATAYAAVDNQELPFTDYEVLVKYDADD